MFSSRLQLNASKTEVMCFSGRRTPELSSKSVVICFNLNHSVQSVRNLKLWRDSDCSTHTNKTTSSCYASLREIRSIVAPLSLDMRKLLFTFFIISKIDCSNSTLVGLPAYRLEQLQRVINTTAKFIKKQNMTTSLLFSMIFTGYAFARELTIKYLHKSFLGHAPSNLPFTRIAQIPARRGLRSATRGSLVKSSA